MGRQTGSRWERDEDGAREQRGGPRRPGSRKTASGEAGDGNGGVYLELGEPETGDRRQARGRGSRRGRGVGRVGATRSEATIAAR